MALVACQHDPTLRALTTRALGCEPSTDGTWRVALEDTVLYPEGGGQPADHGTISGVAVSHVERDAEGRIWHHTSAPVEGGEVEVVVDWARRWDHMQQHSAQHLLTAIAQDRFGLATTSFHLHAERCDVELSGPIPTAEQLVELEDAVNAAVLADLPLKLRLVDAADLTDLVDQSVRTRGLPEDIVGPVRLVEIEGIDVNTCGGTHVQRTGQLGVVMLLGTERVRGGTRLFFNAGDRVRRMLGACLRREGTLTRRLPCGPEGHADAVSRLREHGRAAAKALKALRTELAEHLGRELGASTDAVAVLHRDIADLGLLGVIAAAATRATPPELTPVRLLTGGPERGAGVFLLVGPDAQVAALGPEVAGLLKGRGGGRGGRYQGKAAALEHRAEATALLRERLA